MSAAYVPPPPGRSMAGPPPSTITAQQQQSTSTAVQRDPFHAVSNPHMLHVLSGHLRSGEPAAFAWDSQKIVGRGHFGQVWMVNLRRENGGRAMVAVKRVPLDRKRKDRELELMREMNHRNVCELHGWFITSGSKGETFSNLVMDYMPFNVHDVLLNKGNVHVPLTPEGVQLYMYQLFRALTYLHQLDIAHRDIKPHNLLVDPATGTLKLCDFGSSKRLYVGETNVAYMSTRFYRAPELIFGTETYTCAIDVWSAACILAELTLGVPLFQGRDAMDQLVEIFRVLGTPTPEDVRRMAPSWTEPLGQVLAPANLHNVFPGSTSPHLISLLSALLTYNPAHRPFAIDALSHPYFDALREPGATRSNGRPLPPLFDFSHEELSVKPELIRRLVPPHAEPALRERGIKVDDFRPLPPAPSVLPLN